jgi:hypothetical protein
MSADAVIVGSAVVQTIEEALGYTDVRNHSLKFDASRRQAAVGRCPGLCLRPESRSRAGGHAEKSG